MSQPSFRVSDYAWPAFQGRKPFQHQRHTVRFAIKHRNVFILNEMGTGKTLSALWAADILMLAKKVRRVLVVCPKSTLKAVWLNEIFLNLPHRRAGIAHGNAQIRRAVLQNAAYEFVIINHDGIKIEEDEIIRQSFDIVIIDELTAFKWSTSDRSKAMERVARSARAVWGMTGDLTPNSPLEAFWPIKIVNPQSQYLPKYFGQYRDACMVQINEIVWVPKPEAPQIVAMCAQPAVRFTRDQCLDLPDTTYQVLEVPITAEQREYYETMKKAALIETDSGAISAQSAAIKLNKLLQISAGAVKNDAGQVVEIGCKDRVDQLWQIFEETPQRKLVVFATYRATIEMLVRELTKRGAKVNCIHGDVPQNLRASHIDRFQNGDLEILVLQPQSTAHGITLTAANTMVWFSLIPSNEYFQQGCARIIRAGQTRKTLIFMFVGTSAEKHISRLLQSRADLSKEILRLFADHEI
jgi:SNF2 family DNA or RNA helicase